MAKIVVSTIPDGDYCSDKHWLDCPFARHEAGLHRCELTGRMLLDIQIIKVNGERIRVRRKLEGCRTNITDDTGNGFVPDKE